MNLSPNIPETMIPGSYTGYNYYAGPNGLPANIQKVLLIGDKSSAGSIAAKKSCNLQGNSSMVCKS